MGCMQTQRCDEIYVVSDVKAIEMKRNTIPMHTNRYLNLYMNEYDFIGASRKLKVACRSVLCFAYKTT